MINKGVAYEAILIVGVLVAVGFSLVQLMGVFYGQQLIGKGEVVSAFAKDLESIMDKAVGTTGDAVFIYYPAIKYYSVKIKNNTVTITDKLSNLSAHFSKSFFLVDNSFEDCEKIFIIKKEEKILITCKCFELGEACTNSLQCCSGFCNLTSGKCEEPPICPRERVCIGAPEAIKIGGKDCCPSDKPICSFGHCCPVDKPRWCNTPLNGDSRCMSESEYSADCKPTKVYHLVFVPIGYDDFDDFKADAEKSFEEFLKRIPLRECSDMRTRIQAHFIMPGETPECQISSCSNICFDCIRKALVCAHSIQNLKGIINKVAALCKDNKCPGTCGCANGIPGTGSASNMKLCRGVLYEIPTHEIGHTMGLGHVDCDVACHACPPFASNCNCQDCSLPLDEKKYFVMDYCYPMERFGPAAYQCLKEHEFKDYMC